MYNVLDHTSNLLISRPTGSS